MKFSDSHCHIFLDEFKEDLGPVVQRALDRGVDKLFLPNIEASTLDALLKVCETYTNTCFPMMGLHPCSVKDHYKEELDLVESELEKGMYVAVGEIGLDLYWDKSHFTQQLEALNYQLDLAKRHQLPAILHCRDSFDELLSEIQKAQDGNLKGIFHCFTGSHDDALSVIDSGFLIGIGGVLSFKNSGLREQIKNIPLEYMVLETDSPYLTPAPNRGKRNEPSYIADIAQVLADTKEVSVEEVARITYLNTLKLFGISNS